VMEALDRTGKTEDTLLIVTSDNGALPGDRIRDESGKQLYRLYDHKSCGDWRGYKAHIWEGGHREPLIARWPGRIIPATTTDALTCLTDFMATCAAIVSQDLPDNAAQDSYNILPVLLGEEGGKPESRKAGKPERQRAREPVREDVIHHSSTGVFSIRHGCWKLILETLGSGGWPPPRDNGPKPGSPGQLYNIAEDPKEENNLWGDHPEIVERLTALLEGYRNQGRSVPFRHP